MVAVLYEDKRGPRKRFGFHRFICQCVLDRLPGFAINVYQAENLVTPIVCKGNGNVFEKCKEGLERLANRYRRVIAVYDQDKLPELLKLTGPQCRNTLREKLAEECQPRESLEIVFINKNLESVIEAIRDSGLASFVDANVFAEALNKQMDARDRLFIKCATQSTKEVREKLLELLPDVKRLIAKIVEFSKAAK